MADVCVNTALEKYLLVNSDKIFTKIYNFGMGPAGRNNNDGGRAAVFFKGVVNRRAYFDYEILETYEAGIELRGFEVKAIKIGHINLAGTFVVIKNNEAWLLNATIPPYQPRNAPPDYDPMRSRKLLLHKSEIKELIGKSAQRGLTIVALKVYTKRGRIKILVGLARHKKKADKREVIKKREAKREIRRNVKRG